MGAFQRRTPRTPEEQKRSTPKGWKPSMNEPLPVVRCNATTLDGKQCGAWSIRGGRTCPMHSGPQDYKEAAEILEAARLRLIGLVSPAVDTIEELLEPGTGEAVRLKAAETILDRAGLVKGQEINVTVSEDTRAVEEVQKKLDSIRNRQIADKKRKDELVVEVEEVVEDGDPERNG